ncbi:MAG: flagellar biosynthesis protein FlhB [Granulosicoccaceae bacterium]
MAGGDDSQEKTEDPTEKRLKESKDKGQVPRSRDFNTMAIMIAGAVGLWLQGANMASDLQDMLRGSFSVARADLLADHAIVTHLIRVTLEALLVIAPLCVLLTVIALVSPLVLGGWSFALDSVTPKWERVSPLSGIKRMFSVNSLMELLKGILKVILVGAIAVGLISLYKDRLLVIGGLPLFAAIQEAGSVLLISFVAMSCGLLVIAAIDAPFQVWQFTQKQKMSMQEVRDESKETNGKPEVKQRIRQLQVQYSQQRMIEDIPKADVIITNPTHFAVALKYDQNNMEAPQLLAKGTDDFALRIREVAKKHRVPIVRVPPLARALFYSTRVDAPIPGPLYLAVAQVLAFVQQVRQARLSGVAPPPTPRPKVPKDFLSQYEGDNQ